MELLPRSLNYCRTTKASPNFPPSPRTSSSLMNSRAPQVNKYLSSSTLFPSLSPSLLVNLIICRLKTLLYASLTLLLRTSRTYLPVPPRRRTRPAILVNVFPLHDALPLLIPRCCRQGVLVAPSPWPALALEGSLFLHVADAALAVVLDVLGQVDEVLDVLLLG